MQQNHSPAEFSARFAQVATKSAAWVGSPWAFISALIAMIVWGLTGPHFHYSDTWQLVVNTGTTIVTFLMVFLIQNTQNRDARAIHLKLDEVIRSIRAAHNELINIEKLSDAELDELAKHYERIREECEVRLAHKSSSGAQKNEARRVKLNEEVESGADTRKGDRTYPSGSIDS